MAKLIFKRCISLFFITVFLFAGCKQPVQQLTKEESVTFAKEIETAIKKGDGNLLDNSFDKNEFIKRMNLPNTANGKGFSEGVSKKINIGSQIVKALSDQDNFEFIKHYVKENKHHLIFRMFTTKDESLNYHDYEILKAGGKCKIADAYIYLTGETIAETMHNMFNSLFQESLELDKYTEDEKLKAINELKEVRVLMQKGNIDGAKKLYETLPNYLKKTKTALLINVIICSRLTISEYSEAIKEFKELFPDEPNMNLIMIDGYFLQKDYIKVLAAVNALDAQINKDPFLDYHRYLAYNLLEDKISSLSCLKRLVKNMPNFQKGYIELIAVDLKNKNNSEADSLIKIYRNTPRFSQPELTTIINYYQ